MSLYGALNIGVAGLAANSQALSVTSSNIANVNTVGYKEGVTQFSTFLNANLGTGANSSAGVAAVATQDVTVQGLPTTTSSPTDLSISGNGFFVVSAAADGDSGAGIYPRWQLHARYRRQSGEFRRPLSLGLQVGFFGQHRHQFQRPQPDQCQRTVRHRAALDHHVDQRKSAGQRHDRFHLCHGRHGGGQCGPGFPAHHQRL